MRDKINDFLYELKMKKNRLLIRRRNKKYNMNRIKYDRYYGEPRQKNIYRKDNNTYTDRRVYLHDMKTHIVSRPNNGRKINIKSRKNLDCVCCALIVCVLIAGVIAFSKKTTSQAASTATHNFTRDEMNSCVFNISGNLTDSAGLVNYKGLRLTKSLKMDNASVVSFTTTADSTLTLVFGKGNNDIRIDGLRKKSRSGVFQGKLSRGTHMITTSSKANLYYISLSDGALEGDEMYMENSTMNDNSSYIDANSNAVTSDVNLLGQ